MELQYRNEATVGLIVIVAVVIIVAGLAWLKGQPVFGGSRLVVQAGFADAQAVQAGDPVLVSGVAVGRVSGVEIRGVRDVVVTLSIDPQWRPRIDAWAEVREAGFVGDRFVDYWPGEASDMLPDDGLVDGRSAGAIMSAAAELAERADTILGSAQEVLTGELIPELRLTLQSTRLALDALTEAFAGPLAGQAVSTLSAFEQAAVRLDSTLSNPDLARALNGLDEVTQSLGEMTAGFAGAGFALQSILSQVAEGNGSLGKLVTDTTLHNDLHLLTTAMTALLVDLRERPGRYLTVKVF